MKLKWSTLRHIIIKLFKNKERTFKASRGKQFNKIRLSAEENLQTRESAMIIFIIWKEEKHATLTNKLFQNYLSKMKKNIYILLDK